MEIAIMNRRDLKPADYNPRIDLQPGMPEYEKLKNSLIKFGAVLPVVFNKRTGNLVGGHQQLIVAECEGWPEETSVSIVDLGLTEEKILNIALNKLDGRWDDSKLADLLQEIGENSEEINLTGFDESEVSKLVDSFTSLSDSVMDDFLNKEIDLDDFADDEFDCECPKCGFKFNKEYLS